ncbi:uncharacterized protein A4U43_C08F2170 [Asparagus officinalis]|nr:uncharacterized protein A4U43_C08F2170 [Asparagus officinalis]
MVTLRRLPRTSAHTPSLSASMGHLPVDGLGPGFGGLGPGFGGHGQGFGGGQEATKEATRLKKRMFRVRKRTREALVAAIRIVGSVRNSQVVVNLVLLCGTN